jgi:hypothetical protein
MLLSFSW